jgi:type II secretory pathway pseudopilin PulG
MHYKRFGMKLSNYRRNNAQQASLAGFTLIELLMMIAVLALLAAILAPSFSKVRDSARSTRSVSNLRQLGVAINMRATEHGGRYPIVFGPQVKNGANILWSHEISPYLSSDNQPPSGPGSTGLIASLWPLFISPTTIAPPEFDPSNPYLDSTYSMNGNLNEITIEAESRINFGLPKVRVINPAQTVLLIDGGQWESGSQADASLYNVYLETLDSTTPNAYVATPSPNPEGLFGHGNIAYRDKGRAATLWCDGSVSHIEPGGFKHKHFNIRF